MKNLRTILLAIIALIFTTFSGNAIAMSATDLNHDADHTLHILTSTTPLAANIAGRAKAILIFPNIVKAGLAFGGAYGEGVLKQHNKIEGYYNFISASFGWQAGAQSYGYVVFLMNDKAVQYVRKTHGWEVGVGPTIVIVNEGVAKNLSTTTLKDDAYAFIFDQQGLMASLSIEGTKISRIKNL